MSAPEIIIDLDKIAHNTRVLQELYKSRGIEIAGVTKVVSGNPKLAHILIRNGIKVLADSRLSNIKRMQRNGVKAKYLLLRTLLSEVDEVVKYTDISLNSALSVINALSLAAQERNTTHQVILMVELGDLREGIMPSELHQTVSSILKMKGIELIGIGTNLACFSGAVPDEGNMRHLSSMAGELESEFNISLPLVSGGNSSNYQWFMCTPNVGRINHLRLGESLFLGCEPLQGKPIPELFTNAFTIHAEVIESSIKPSKIPKHQKSIESDKHTKGAFKQTQRAILAIGKQDVLTIGLVPPSGMQIIGASSDHLILNTNQTTLCVGEKVAFGINYDALLSAMHSHTVDKKYVHAKNDGRVLPNGRRKRLIAQVTFPYC